MNTQAPYEHGFMLSLLALAIGGLIWLFYPFIPALFFALLIAIASYSRYQSLAQKTSNAKASLMLTSIVGLLLMLPLGYVLLVSTLEINALIQNINQQFDVQSVNAATTQLLQSLPIPQSLQQNVISGLENNLESILLSVKDFSVNILSGIVSLSSGFIFFVLVVLFALFYFYIDGEEIVRKIKHLTPLENRLDDVLFNHFAQLSITLVGSVFIIALLQGVLFSIAAMLAGLPALYFGLAMALASFIPVLGGLIVWLPLSLYLYAQGQLTEALIILVFGALIIGTVVDNFIRPIVIKHLSGKSEQSNALDHTLITVLSTLAGIIQFGVLGLFIGPIIAAMAISIFDVYALKYAQTLDQS